MLLSLPHFKGQSNGKCLEFIFRVALRNGPVWNWFKGDICHNCWCGEMQYIIVMYKRFFMMFGRGESLFTLLQCVTAHFDDIPSSKFPLLFSVFNLFYVLFFITSLESLIFFFIKVFVVWSTFDGWLCCSEHCKRNYQLCILVSPSRTLTAFTPLAFCSSCCCSSHATEIHLQLLLLWESIKQVQLEESSPCPPWSAFHSMWGRSATNTSKNK